MTEGEVIKICNTIILAASQSLSNPQGIPLGVTKEELVRAMRMAKKAFIELQQYRTIGTVEECMEAVAKQAAKKVCGIHKSEAPDDIENYGEETLFGYCPVCGELQNTLWNSSNCGDCGQKLDWGEEEL